MPSTSPRTLRSVGRATRWVAAGLLLIVAGLSVRTLLFLRTARPTDATVVRVDVVKSHSGKTRRETTTYKPTFQFNDAAGVAHIVTLDHSASHYNYATEQRVPILYSPDDLTRVRVNSFFGLWFIHGTCTTVALSVGLMSIIFSRLGRAEIPAAS